jgi:hypothetical protein
MLEKPASVILYASQIAACIGCNRHKKPAEAMESMWERMDPESYKDALRRTGCTTEADRIQEIIQDDAFVKHVVDQSTLACGNSNDVATKYDAASRVISGLDLGDDDKKVIDATVKRNLYTNYGTASEHHALVKVRDMLSINAKTDDTFYKSHVGDVDGIALWVGGKIDAITEDRSLVIEIKNRIRRLFYKIPFYEIIQLQTYLHLLDVSRGAVVECLTTAGDSMINIVPIRRDRGLWNDMMVPKMKAYTKVLADLLTNVEFQDAFLLSSKKAAMIQARMNAAMG